MQTVEYLDHVTLCDDGVYRWTVTLSQPEAVYVRKVVLLTTGLICLFLVVFSLVIGMDGSEFAAMMISCAMAMLIALIVCMFAARTGKLTRSFEMTETEIRCMNPKMRQTIRFSDIRKVTVRGKMLFLSCRLASLTVFVPEGDFPTVRFHITSRLSPGTEVIEKL